MIDGNYYWFVTLEYYDKMSEILNVNSFYNVDELKKLYKNGLFIFMTKCDKIKFIDINPLCLNPKYIKSSEWLKGKEYKYMYELSDKSIRKEKLKKLASL